MSVMILSGGLVLGHAAVHGDDVVRAALVDAGDDAAARRAERACTFCCGSGTGLSMPMIGSTCANCPSSFGAEAVFPFELFRIGQVLKLAAAALLLCGQRLFFRSARSWRAPPVFCVVYALILPFGRR